MTPSRPARGFDWRNLGLRAASAVVLIGAALVAVFVDQLFFVMISIAVAVLAIEWAAMSTRRAPLRVALIITVAALAPLFIAYVHHYRWSFPMAWALIFPGALLAAVLAGVLSEGPGDTAFGVVYIAGPCLALSWIRAMPNPVSWTILLFAVTWSADICAFLVGNALKGPKLWPRFSPNKTWSGFAGGLLGAMGAAIATSHYSTAKLSFGAAALIGLSGGLATMAGDLWESMLKRRYGVKDSGDLIPGHGGLLDRVDGLMFAVLAVAGARLVHQYGWGH
ncbi:MAG TPA: phosphatidate cytidylyltransferase [Caulobacteraceae bacterium]|nr:phosphatidate cytidylyltransferase [Caulobacteraceae bacterium]